uniref:STAS-like domain-containing protein n=1 Tax=Candidatus Thiodubiliella endoseptemdiera TaxID=2738886 RepID=UPI0034E00563
MIISIAKNFSDVPAGRYYADGEWTGQKFREEVLVPALKKADKKNPVIVDINGAEGYGSSFLEEAFGGLIREEGHTKDRIKEILEIKANDTYDIYKQIILDYIKKA